MTEQAAMLVVQLPPEHGRGTLKRVVLKDNVLSSTHKGQQFVENWASTIWKKAIAPLYCASGIPLSALSAIEEVVLH